MGAENPPMTPAQWLTERLNGKWHRRGYGYVSCVCHEDAHPSLRLRDGENGKLLVHCDAGCDARDILADLRRRNLIGGVVSETDEKRLEEMAQQRREKDRRERIKMESIAGTIWRASQSAAETLVEVYLRHRAITIPIPPSIRFHPNLLHKATGLKLPAMVAAVQAPDRKIRGVHRTFLTQDGTRKAQVSDERMSLGSISGGAVRLAAATSELAIGEGIETCLSYMQATGIPTWAALSTSGMRAIELPLLPLAATVYLAADLDSNGAGEAAAEAAAERFHREGRKVKIARPTTGNDFNDALMASDRS
jgi:putative DNA primase/helicase